MTSAPSTPIRVVRCYRFALRPAPMQARALARATGQARRQWNEMVALLRWAENEQRHGRREALLHEYGRILQTKKLWGAAFTKARQIMRERGLTDEAQAIALSRAEQAQAARKHGRRGLALAYAVERAQANVKRKPLVFSAQTAVAIVRKFDKANAHYVGGRRGRPHFKRGRGPVTLQRQIDPDNVNTVDFARGTVDLASLTGSECCRAVPVVLHRPLPEGAKIKQIAITSTSARTFIILMVEAPAAAFMRPVPALSPSVVAGIDPGRHTALSVSDAEGRVQFSIKPPLDYDRRFLRRRRRLQRRASRQHRAANPARLDEKGCWKKSRAKVVVSQGWRRTCARMGVRPRHVAAARRETYHLEANRLLREFAVVGIGNWRGNGRGWRAQNRRDHGNALGLFTRLLKEKAPWCSQSRQVVDVHEAYTTRACTDCGALTGPSGEKDLGVRIWTCTSCGQTHQRDFASARAIARRALAQTAAGAQPAQPELPQGKARTPAASPTQVPDRPVRTASPSARNPVSASERRRGVSAVSLPPRDGAVGMGVAATPAPYSPPPSLAYQPELPLGMVRTAAGKPTRPSRARSQLGSGTTTAQTACGNM